jgi:hypothetical protein
MGNTGTFSADISVPPLVAPGNHQVVGKFGAESASATFSVEAPPSSSSALRVALVPSEGRAGDFFKIEGSGYNKCSDRGNNLVDIYDRNTSGGNGFSLALARNVPIDAQGMFSVVVQMPQTAASGSHEIDSQCLANGEYASAVFTVTGPTTGSGPTGSGPTSSGPTSSGPTSSGPTSSGPTSSGPTSSGPTSSGPTSSGPTGSGSTLPPFPLPPDPHQVKRAYLATQVSSPIEVFSNPLLPLQLLLSGALLVLLLLVVAFPAVIFESTFEKNRAEINGWFRWVPRLPRLNLPSWVHLDILGLVAAVLLLMAAVPLDDLDFDEATLAQGVGYLLAVPLVAVVLEMPGDFYSRWKRRSRDRSRDHKQREPQWRVLPAALFVAGFLAVLSRLADFAPPYVYGLIAVYIGADRALKNLNKKEAEAERGFRALIGMLCLFAASVVAWLVWTRLDRAFHHQGLEGFGWVVFDAFLATFFLLALEAVVFGMIPLTFLKGQEVWRWKPVVCIATLASFAFIYLNVQFVAGAGEAVDLSMEGILLKKTIKAAVLFVVFGVLSFAFWAYFQPRVRKWFSNVQQRFAQVAHR